MNIFRFISFLFIIYFITFLRLGYAKNNVTTNIKAFYCPSIISCNDNNIQSCTSDSEYSNYFDKLKISQQEASIRPGLLRFRGASSSFHSGGVSSNVAGSCGYSYDGDSVFTLILPIKPEANLEAYYQAEPVRSLWEFNSNGARCVSSSVSLCPLKSRLGFVFHNHDLSTKISLEVNGVQIGSIPVSSYVSISYEDVLNFCSADSECTVNILYAKNIKIGSVKFSMSDMKILQTNSIFPDKFLIVKSDIFDVVEIKDQAIEEHGIYCPSEINCSTGSIESCTFDSVDKKHLGIVKSDFESWIAGRHLFIGASQGRCIFNHQLRLENPEILLEPYYLKDESLWTSDGCYSSSPINCPFQLRTKFVIHNVNMLNGLYTKINGNRINDVYLGYYQYISYYEIMNNCDSGKSCMIDLFSGRGLKYGSIFIDLDTMKVMQIMILHPDIMQIVSRKIPNVDASVVDVNYLAVK